MLSNNAARWDSEVPVLQSLKFNGHFVTKSLLLFLATGFGRYLVKYGVMGQSLTSMKLKLFLYFANVVVVLAYSKHFHVSHDDMFLKAICMILCLS